MRLPHWSAARIHERSPAGTTSASPCPAGRNCHTQAGAEASVNAGAQRGRGGPPSALTLTSTGRDSMKAGGRDTWTHLVALGGS